jgi:hypothetical protein
MAYPRRGAWSFYNVRRASSFYPTLESIEIGQEFPDVVATFSCEVVDEDADQTFEVEDEVRVTFDGERIFAGHLKIVTEDRVEEFGPRKWRLEAQDYTAKLGDAIIRQRAQRRKEAALRRIRWILGYLDNAWNVDGRELDVPDEEVERQDMYGMTVAEALDSVANEVGLRFWIDLENVVHVEKATTTPAPFALSNVAPDLVTTFPFREFSYRRDSTELANAILVEPEKREDSRWSVAQGNIDTYAWGDSTGRQELFIAAEEIRSARAAERHGDAQLQRTKVPEGEVELTCYQPGVWAGMTIDLTEALWGYDATPMKVVRVDISAVDPHDDDGTAYLKSVLTLNNKRKRRKPKMGRAEGETADTTPKVVDNFSRTVAPATIDPGSSLGVSITTWRASRSVDVNGNEVPFALKSGGVAYVASYVGAWYKTISAPDYACSYPKSDFRGWVDREVWGALTVPAHPAGMAGIYVTIRPYGADGSGYGGGGRATIDGVEVVVRSSAPTDTWQGTPIGKVYAFDADTTVLIPASAIPVEGGQLWVGVRPGWRCDYATNAPYCDYPLWPYDTGLGNSGKCQASVGSPVWAVSSDDPIAWGETADGHAWQDAGTEGAPVAGMDGDSFYVEGAGGQGLAVVGERDSDEEATGSWSDASWATELRFSASALATGGSITLTTTGQGSQVIGTIDLDSDPGMAVGGPTTSDAESVAIGAGEVWVAKFDSRSGSMRGKVWRAGTPEPATWNVEVPIEATEDDADRFELWVRSGTGQTIRVLDLKSMDAARPGEEVVTELVGHADGTTNRFRTSHRFRDGTLTPYVLGIAAPATIESGATTEFTLDYFPTVGSAVHVSYTVAGDDDT